MYIQQNPNPYGRRVGDCTVRAISIALNQDWFLTYWGMCLEGAYLGNMPDGNEVWGSYLAKHGFVRDDLPNKCPACYTVRDFAADHRAGVYVLGTQNHAVAVIDGNYVDAFDSGDEVPVYVWRKE